MGSVKRGARAGVGLAGFVVLLLFAAPVHALPRDEPFDRFVIKTWGPEDGVPQGEIWSIAQTPDGFLWVGSTAGVGRFDGVGFRSFRIGDKTPELTPQRSPHLGVDAAGRIWLAGAKPLLFVDGRFMPQPDPGFGANRFDLDGSGHLWLAGSLGIARLNHLQRPGVPPWDVISRPPQPVGGIIDMAAGPSGTLWLATGRGLWRFAAGAWTPDPRVTESLFAVVVRGNGELWVAGKLGAARVGPDQVTRFDNRDGLPEDRVYALHEDRDGTLWAATRGGLARWRGERFEPFAPLSTPLLNRVWSLGEDSDGNLWLGTTGRVTRVRLAAAFSARLPDAVDDPTRGRARVPTALAPYEAGIVVGDGTGRLALVGPDGTVGPERWRLPAAPNRDSAVIALLRDSKGRLWIGRDGNHPRPLCHIDGDRVTCVGREVGLAADEVVSALFEDAAGTVWIGGRHLYRWSAGDARALPDATAGGAAPPDISCFAEDGAGRLWLGTPKGLWYRSTDGWHEEAATARSGLILPYSLLAHRDGSLWIGTGRGLIHLRNDRALAFRSEDGFTEGSIYALAESEGMLWLATETGVVRVRLSDLAAFEDGRLSAIPSSRLGLQDGLASQQVSGNFSPVAINDGRGRFWVAMLGGVSVVDMRPAAARSRPPPMVAVESFWIEDRKFEPFESVDLTRGRGTFAAGYTAPELTAPERIRFRYRLDPYDQDWIFAGSRRRADYTNLPPAAYRFRIAAQYDDGVWNTRETTLAFRLRPPFWDTPWFKGGMAALLAALAYLGYRWRLQRLRSEHGLVVEERTRIARELHDTVAQGFSAIAINLEAAARQDRSDPDAANRHVDRARSIAKASAAEARRAIWALRHQALARGDLPAALAHVVAVFAESRPVQFTTEGPVTRISEAEEQALLRVAQEALTNVARHANAGRVSVDLAYAKDQVTLFIEDDGRGFQPDAGAAIAGDHYGLTGMRERLSAVGGSLVVDSRPGAGTRITATLALGRGARPGVGEPDSRATDPRAVP